MYFLGESCHTVITIKYTFEVCLGVTRLHFLQNLDPRQFRAYPKLNIWDFSARHRYSTEITFLSFFLIPYLIYSYKSRHVTQKF